MAASELTASTTKHSQLPPSAKSVQWGSSPFKACITEHDNASTVWNVDRKYEEYKQYTQRVGGQLSRAKDRIGAHKGLNGTHAAVWTLMSPHLADGFFEPAELAVDATTLDGKVLVGYQGWFQASGDDSGMPSWKHWSCNGSLPTDRTYKSDFWPDQRELGQDELFSTGFHYQNGSNARLFSSFNARTVLRHFQWMYEYGLDGALLGRFLHHSLDMPGQSDIVLSHVRRGSKRYGRVFAIHYNIFGIPSRKVMEVLQTDWAYLVDTLKITQSKSYLHHNGRPVLSIFGFGFERTTVSPSQANEIIDWFHQSKYSVTLIGCVPVDWRTQKAGKLSSDKQAWQRTFQRFDVIRPWTVGRVHGLVAADKFRRSHIEPDLEECRRKNISYLPTVFPGGSWTRSHPMSRINANPRLGGTFMWRQFYNAIHAGCRMVFVAMFDEIGEGSAIFKLAENQEQVPVGGRFLTLDADGHVNPDWLHVPSDWYLRLTGQATALLRHGKHVMPREMPKIPARAASSARV